MNIMKLGKHPSKKLKKTFSYFSKLFFVFWLDIHANKIVTSNHQKQTQRNWH